MEKKQNKSMFIRFIEQSAMQIYTSQHQITMFLSNNKLLQYVAKCGYCCGLLVWIRPHLGIPCKMCVCAQITLKQKYSVCHSHSKLHSNTVNGCMIAFASVRLRVCVGCQANSWHNRCISERRSELHSTMKRYTLNGKSWTMMTVQLFSAWMCLIKYVYVWIYWIWHTNFMLFPLNV